MKKMKIKHGLFLTILSLLVIACEDSGTPLPYAYPRIDVPSKEYSEWNDSSDCPYTFEINQHAQWQDEPRGYCWGNIVYPDIRAKVQLTYKPVEGNIERLLNEARELAYTHTVKADGIGEQLYQNDSTKVYGLLYRMRGEAATTTQFFVTDSTDHFLRGVVYFASSPNADSLKPVNEYMAEEVIHLMETTKWKNK